nr:reverse transcriptase domain-containing protein [Tanacetum cinerariifolium]
MEVEGELLEPWILFTNRSSYTDGSRERLILTNPEGMEFSYALRFRSEATNNEAEYEALIAGLRTAEQMGVKNLQANVDSQLVANQGINIAEPFLEGLGKVKFLIVAMDYFTKWIEAKPVATINGNQVKKFVWDNIVCRFELPGEIISDNGKQFQDNPFKDCPREGIKAKLDAESKNWIEELSYVLWAHHTMIKSSNGDTPFSLTYKTEAVIPAKIVMSTLRTAEVNLIQNYEALGINLDLLEEKREQAAIREAKSKTKTEKYYNSKVRSARFKSGGLVYCNNYASRAEDTRKLGPKWEGPYEVTEALGKGAYKLRDRGGKQLSRTWNVSNLKKCYIHKM